MLPNIKNYLLVTLISVIAVGLHSCKKDKDPEEKVIPIVEGEFIGKWIIKDAKSQIYSVELLNDAHYLIELNYAFGKVNTSTTFGPAQFLNNAKAASSLIRFGTYRVEGDKIILEGFGIIGDMEFTEAEFHFSFSAKENATGTALIATKFGDTISESDKTNLLCQTWDITRVTKAPNMTEEQLNYLLMNIGTTDDNTLTSMYKGSNVLFSRAGTYLSLYPTGLSYLSSWRWANSQEKEIEYTHSGWSDPANIGKVTIANLTSKTVELRNEYLIYYLTK